jgi:hypothetical protein
LQVQTTMPLSMTQQEHMPPWSIVQRFCTMLQAILSSQLHVIFMPPVHFSNLYVQRGTIIQLVPTGIPVGVPVVGDAIPGIATPGMPMPLRSIIIALDIPRTPFSAGDSAGQAPSHAQKPGPRAIPGTPHCRQPPLPNATSFAQSSRARRNDSC